MPPWRLPRLAMLHGPCAMGRACRGKISRRFEQFTEVCRIGAGSVMDAGPCRRSAQTGAGILGRDTNSAVESRPRAGGRPLNW